VQHDGNDGGVSTQFDEPGGGYDPFTPPHQQQPFASDPFGQPQQQDGVQDFFAADTMGSQEHMAKMHKQQQLVDLEWEWETEAVAKSVQRYEQFRSSAQDRSALADMSAVEKLMVGWYPELLERIKRVRLHAAALVADRRTLAQSSLNPLVLPIGLHTHLVPLPSRLWRACFANRLPAAL
jgi:hypothetical protein